MKNDHTRYQTSVLLFIFSMFVMMSCGSSKKAAEIAEPDYFVAPDLNSVINIHYRIKKQSLTDTFNFVLDEMMREELKFEDYNANVKIKRIGNTIVDFQGKSAMITIPVQLDVLKKTLLKDFKANGSLELVFLSNLEIGKDWKFSTETMLLNHRWTKKPVIDLGIIDLPIEALANFVIRKTQADIVKNIDASMKEQYNLPMIIKEVSRFTLTPFELDSVFGGWFQMQADSAFLTPTFNTKSHIEGKISLKTQMNLSSSRPSEEKFNIRVPPFAWKEKVKDSSYLQMVMELDYAHLQKIANDNFAGKVFEDGGKSLEILNIAVGKSKGKLQLTVNARGSFNGKLILTGIPAFDRQRSLLYCTDVNLSVRTGNVLHKAASWLLKGKIKSQLDKMLQFNLSENLNTVQEQVNIQVEEMNKKYKMELKADIGSVMIDNMALRPEKINAYITVRLWLGTTLNSLLIFQN